jgi:subtilase family serine protease
MHVTVVLKPRDPVALAAYAREVSTPGSSIYHAFLTPEQFAARFGASAAEVRAVQRSMRTHGLIAGPAAANRLAVPVAGSTGAIERAFALTFRRVAIAGGRRAVVASAAPGLDRGIAGGVQAVIGLTSIAAPQPLLERSSPASRVAANARLEPHVVTSGPRPCADASSVAASQGAYTADQIASAYRFGDLYSSGAEGQGQTIAIYELERYDTSDIASYQRCYGINASITNVLVDGGPGGSPAGSGEATLDIEQAIGLAPKANIRVYQGPNSSNDAPGSGPYDTLSAIVAEDLAHVVSISWGQCEQAQGSNVLDAEQTLLEEAATQGQSVVSATGDQGSEDCKGTNSLTSTQLAVDDPGSQLFVTGVGGTTLQSAGPPPSETVWNHRGAAAAPRVGQGGAGGGGVSNAWAMPGYQLHAPSWLSVIGAHSSGANCRNAGGYCRQVPDVSADADPAHGYLIYWNGSGTNTQMPQGWQAVGGTSAAAPLWAALLADADSTSTCRGSAIGFADPALYHAAGAGYGNYFNDVTTGNNDFTGTNNGQYPAGFGYDMASGLGSPKAGALAAALCAGSLRVNNPGPQLSTVGRLVSLRISTSALPGARLQFFASRLPPGLSISRATGRITGRPRRIGTWRSGIAVIDQNLSLRGAFFTWQVAGAPSVAHVALSGVAAGRPKLAFTVTAGRKAPWLKAISIRLSSGLSFARTARRVTIAFGGRRLAFSSRLVGGRLRVLLAAPVWRIRVTIATGAIRTTARLAANVQRQRHPVVAIAVMTTDSSGHGVAARARIKPLG